MEHAYHQYTILIDREKTPNGKGRDGVRAALIAREIGAGIYYPTPLHLNPLFASLGYERGSFPVAEQLSEQVLSLPVHPGVTRGMINDVCDAVRDAMGA